MSVEIRQMVVKSNVLQRCEAGDAAEKDKVQPSEEARSAILEECRKLVIEMLRERKER